MVCEPNTYLWRTSKILHQHIDQYRPAFLAVASPADGTKVTGELNAVADIFAVAPHSEELRIKKFSKRRGLGCWGGNYYHNLSRTLRNIFGQGNYQLSVRLNVRAQVQCSNHALALKYPNGNKAIYPRMTI